jgi:hypothetical protein
VATVQRIVSAQRVDPATALDAAILDALLAEDAKNRLGQASVRQAERSARARALLEDLDAQAKRQGPPTDGEVAEATERRWWELDRPAMLRTTHVAVLVKKPEDEKPARALAEKIASAVAGATTPAAFRAAAKAVPASNDLEVRVEDLDPMTPDGRALNPERPPPPGTVVGGYEKGFVDAAFAIPSMGKQSPIIQSSFGYHIILAVERVAGFSIPLEERRAMLKPEILEKRATKLKEQTIEQARRVDRVDVERSASDLTDHVKVTP